MAKKRALILTPSVDTRAGGVERFSRLLESALEADGWLVDLLANRGGVSKLVARIGGRPIVESRRAGMMARELGLYDLIITNGTLGWGAPKGRTRIHVIHGTMPAAMLANVSLPWRERVRAGIGGGAAEFLAAQGSAVVAVSRSAAEEAALYYRLRSVRVIENGVDCSLFRPRGRAEAKRRFGLDPNEPLALYVGRVEPRKGATEARQAARLAGFTLAVAGARELSGSLHLGSLQPEDLAWAYSAADCVVFPTRYEACSFVVLEALAAGTPLVTTAVGWARTLAQRVPGYAPLICRPDPESVAESMRCALGSEIRRAASAARDLVVQHNSMERFSADWQQAASAAIAISVRTERDQM